MQAQYSQFILDFAAPLYHVDLSMEVGFNSEAKIRVWENVTLMSNGSEDGLGLD